MAGDPLSQVIKAVTQNQQMRSAQQAEAQAAEAQAMTDKVIAGIRARVEQQNADLEMKSNIHSALAAGQMEAKNGAEAAQNGGGPPPPILQPGGAIWERPVDPRNPTNGVSPDQFMQSVMQYGVQSGAGQSAPQPGAGGGGMGGSQGLPASAQGLPVAGENITTSQVGATLKPQEDAFGVETLRPQISYNQETRPNVLSAQDIVAARQNEQRTNIEDTRLRLEAARLKTETAVEQQRALAGNVKAFITELPPKEAVALAQKIQSGTPEELEELAKGLPKTLSSKVKEASIQAEQARATYYNAMAEKQRSSAGIKASDLTPGQLAMDKKYGAQVAEINQGGGFAKAQTNIAKLDEVAKRLEAGEQLTGGMKRQLPEGVRLFMGSIPGMASDEPSVTAAGDVASVIQQSAKQILGSQYTVKEGDNLVARAYDVRLSPAANAKRLRTAVTEFSEQLKESQREAEFFGKKGTLVGFERNLNPLGDVGGAGPIVTKYKKDGTPVRGRVKPDGSFEAID